MARSAKRRFRLKLQKSFRKQDNIIQIVLCTKAFYSFHRGDVIINNILPYLNICNASPAQGSFLHMQEVERLLCSWFAHISVYSADKYPGLSLVFLN